MRKAWDGRLPPPTKKRIGFVWRGNPIHRNDHNRSIALSSLAPLFGIDAHWVSLQKEFAPGDATALAAFPQIAGIRTDLQDFADTAAVIDRLDLVIAVDAGLALFFFFFFFPPPFFFPFYAEWLKLSNRYYSL